MRVEAMHAAPGGAGGAPVLSGFAAYGAEDSDGLELWVRAKSDGHQWLNAQASAL
jgi:hypothetical protein